MPIILIIFIVLLICFVLLLFSYVNENGMIKSIFEKEAFEFKCPFNFKQLFLATKEEEWKGPFYTNEPFHTFSDSIDYDKNKILFKYGTTELSNSKCYTYVIKSCDCLIYALDCFYFKSYIFKDFIFVKLRYFSNNDIYIDAQKIFDRKMIKHFKNIIKRKKSIIKNENRILLLDKENKKNEIIKEDKNKKEIDYIHFVFLKDQFNLMNDD